MFVDIRIPRRSEVSADLAGIVVLGMHRSGTSSLAGALVRLGGAAPTHLMDPAPGNARGFYESPVIMALNDDVLSAADSHWADLRRLSRSRIDAPTEKALRARALSALAAEYGTSGPPVLKDPRLCRLMDFSAPVFEEAAWSTRVVIPIRSPFEVALSLQRRDGLPLSVGCLLWLRHVLDAEGDSRGASRSIVDWSRFLADWRGELEQISARLRTPWPNVSRQAFESVGTFLSPDLRHLEADAEDVSINPADRRGRRRRLPPVCARRLADDLRKARPGSCRRPLGQRVAREEARFLNLTVRPALAKNREVPDEVDGNMVAPRRLGVEKQAMQAKRAVYHDPRFFLELAP
jgi:hypothetical protein